MSTLLERIQAKANRHASIPFWSWNDRLNENELRRQIRHMHELGMRGFFMHARGGLETPYMGEEWFDCVRACIDEAKALGMEAWAYDENGWPSGFAGGALLSDPANHAVGLVCETLDHYPDADPDILGVYTVSPDGACRVESPNGADTYTVIRRKRDFSYVDVMDPAITEKFIALTHEVYKTECGDEFGKTMPGFFTDEPQYFRYSTPWSDTFPTVFAERFGYDVRDALPALFLTFEGYESYRYDYHLLCHERYYEAFVKPIYEWCEANGVQLTGHSIEEWGLSGQMMCCGGVMPFYRYQQLPGIDYLGRPVKTVAGARQLGSVCEQVGRPVRLTETFACCGWDVSPRELKRLVDLQFAYGVNLLCEHLYPYSERGQRKRDYPNHYSEHNPWHTHFGNFERYFQHLGAALSEGKEYADTLVIHPMHSAYLTYQREVHDQSIAELEHKFTELSQTLAGHQIPFHYGDETILRDLGAVEGDTLRVGLCRYHTVILPFCQTLDASTVTFLRAFLENGGKLLLWDGTPDRIDGKKADLSFLHSTVTYDEIRAASGIRLSWEGKDLPIHMQVRSTDFGRVMYFANTTPNAYRNVLVTVTDCAGLIRLDPLTLVKHPVRGKRNADGTVTVQLDFDDSGSFLLIEEETAYLPMAESTTPPAIALDTLAFTLTERPENMWILDRAALSIDGGAFTEERPIVRLKDELLSSRYADGEITLKFTFTAEALPAALRLVAEPMTYRSVTVNGEAVDFGEGWRIDRSFRVAEIADKTRLGRNEIEMTIAYHQREEVFTVLYGGGNEALRNCLSFDTEIEPIYLFGDFGVCCPDGFADTNKPNVYRVLGTPVLSARGDAIDLGNIVKDGYPFFAGEMTAETVLAYRKGDPTCLKLNGRFAVCRVRINGVELDSNLFHDEYDLAPYLVEGENRLRLSLCFSNRNLLGPHHTLDPEPMFVGPGTFSFERCWRDGVCTSYVEEAAILRFGIGF